MFLGCLCVDFWLWSFASERELDMKQIFGVIICVALFAGLPAFADFDEGKEAYEKDDYETALRELQPLAEEGHAEAQFYLAKMYDGGNGVAQNYKEGVKWYKLSAEQGVVDAQVVLGAIYATGVGASKDYKESVKWYRLAAEQGNADAQNAMGVRYKNGDGVPQNYREAAKWYKLSAEQGDAIAQLNLGFMYASGQGISQDYIRAHMWYNISASNGDERGGENRDDTANKMTLKQIEQAQDLAQECVAKNYKGC